MKRVFGISVLAVLLSACSALPQKTKEEVVAKRADEFAQYLVNQDFDSAREYTTPAYRKSVPEKHFKSKFFGALNWKKVTVKDVQCGDENCQVTYLLDYYSPAVRENLRTELSYRWIEVDGQWWIYIK